MNKNSIASMPDPFRDPLVGYGKTPFPTEASEDPGMSASDPNTEYKQTGSSPKVRTGVGD